MVVCYGHGLLRGMCRFNQKGRYFDLPSDQERVDRRSRIKETKGNVSFILINERVSFVRRGCSIIMAGVSCNRDQKYKKGVYIMKRLNVLLGFLVMSFFTASLVYAVDMGAISSGETRSGSITNPSQTDSFAFTGTVGQTVIIIASRESGGFNPEINLYAPNGILEKSVNCGKYGAATSIQNYQLLQSGTYTIEIHDYGADGTGDYSISLLLIPGVMVSTDDPDGGNILSGEVKTGTVNPRVDTDAYAFTGTVGQTVVIIASRESGGFNPKINLYAPDGILEKSVNCGKYGAATSIQNYQLLQSGTYTIEIHDYDADGTGDYSISLLLIPGVMVSTDDPDGGNILSGEVKTGTVNPRVDTDAYAFTGTVGQTVVIIASRESGGFNPEINLYAPDGILEKSVNCGKYGAAKSIQNYQLLQSGTYTIEIHDYGADGTGDYSISLLLIPGVMVSTDDPDGGNILSGEVKTGTVNPRVDTDAYAFTGTVGQTVVIIASRESGGFNPKINLYAPDGILEKSVNCGKYGAATSIQNYQLLQSGTYTIEIHDYGADGTGDYSLSLTLIGGSPPPVSKTVTKGTITNVDTGDGIAGANVSFKQGAYVLSTVSDGTFSSTEIPVGTYQVEITAVNHFAKTISNVTLSTGVITDLSAALTPKSPVIVSTGAAPKEVYNDGATTTLLTAKVTDPDGPGDISWVVVDLAQIGGSATQEMYDDGTHGDAVSGDGIYSFQTTAATDTPVQQFSLNVTASDLYGFTTNNNIDLKVIKSVTATAKPEQVDTHTITNSLSNQTLVVSLQLGSAGAA